VTTMRRADIGAGRPEPFTLYPSPTTTINTTSQVREKILTISGSMLRCCVTPYLYHFLDVGLSNKSDICYEVIDHIVEKSNDSWNLKVWYHIHQSLPLVPLVKYYPCVCVYVSQVIAFLQVVRQEMYVHIVLTTSFII
jgi:hypothetical protein